MTPEEIINVLRQVDADAKASEGDYYADQFAWHGAGEIADAVEQMAAEIARLREERRWIPVGERLPAVQGDDVLTARGPWEDGGYSIVRGWWNGECWMFYVSDRDSPPVAFWMPLPPGPEANG